VAIVADELGFESLWVAEHLIFPETINQRPGDHEDLTVDPELPLFDPFVVLASLGAKTERIRLGTNIFNIGLRHPFVSARAVATADILTSGRIELGIGVGWLEEEWRAVGLDFRTRGSRVDESIDICQSLWTQPTTSHHGKFFDFDSVVFRPKPVQKEVPIHVGGDSVHALKRVVRRGTGWIGMIQTPSTFAHGTEWLATQCAEEGRHFEEIDRSAIVNWPDRAAIEDWSSAGATRLIVAPWRRSSDAVEGLRSYAQFLRQTPNDLNPLAQ
jgi:probable F420-dependent oxidoreductase